MTSRTWAKLHAQTNHELAGIAVYEQSLICYLTRSNLSLQQLNVESHADNAAIHPMNSCIVSM